MSRHKDIEGPITKAIVEYLRLVLPRGSVVTHVRNEIDIAGPAAARAIAKATAMGMLSGFPDIVAATAGPTTLYIEVKAGKGGLSKPQEAVRNDLSSHGHLWLLARSVDDVADFLKLHGIKNRDMAA